MSGILRMDREVVLEFLKSIKPIMKDRPEAYTRSLCLIPDPVKCTCTFHGFTGEYRVSQEIELLNKTDIIERPFIIEFRSLFTVVSKCENDVFSIVLQGTRPSIPLQGSSVLLENYWRLKDKIVPDESFYRIREDLFIPFEGADMLSFLRIAQKLFSLCNDSSFKRVSVRGGNAFFNFLFSAALLREVKIPDIVLRAQDIPYLIKACSGQEKLEVATLGGHHLFRSGALRFSLPRFKAPDVEMVASVFSRLKLEHVVQISPSRFKDVAEIIGGTIRGVGLVSFRNKAGHLFLIAEDRGAKYMDFDLGACDRDAAVNTKCSSDFFNKIAKITTSVCKAQEQETMGIGVNSDGSIHFAINTLHVISGSIKNAS